MVGSMFAGLRNWIVGSTVKEELSLGIERGCSLECIIERDCSFEGSD